MRVSGQPKRTVWPTADGCAVEVLDQTALPHEVRTVRLSTRDEARHAIAAMQVRGAPLIGVVGAYGVALALREDPSDAALREARQVLCSARPTAVNLRLRVEEVCAACERLPPAQRAGAAFAHAGRIADDEVETSRAIGRHGAALIREAWERAGRRRPVNVLTHCNAGWLATVDWGTALAPVYWARQEGTPVHVWVDETRPRSQGLLTAFELMHEEVPHTLIVDNAGGHLMQHGQVDLCIVGTDRTTSTGDVCNKIGTYLKALAAGDNGVPFYVAAPSSSIDFSLRDGVAGIPIEERDGAEVHEVVGRTASGEWARVRLTLPGTPVVNHGFDVTPARLVTGLVTERGVCAASAEGLRRLFPEAFR